jgi:hypothetical protein
VIVKILYLTYQNKLKAGNQYAVSILTDVDEFKLFKDGFGTKNIKLEAEPK